MRAHLWFVAVGLVLLPSAQASLPQETYPAGILDIAATPIAKDQDFTVSVLTNMSLGVDRITVTVCRFQAASDAMPDLCYMNLVAPWDGHAFSASSAGGRHPAWADGMVIGYKVTVQSPQGDRHAPIDGATPAGYYVETVGQSPKAPAASVPAHPASALGPLLLVAFLGLAAFGRRFTA